MGKHGERYRYRSQAIDFHNSYQTIKHLLELASFQDGKIHRTKSTENFLIWFSPFVFIMYPEKNLNRPTGRGAPANDHIASRNRRVAVQDRPPLHGDSTRPFCLATNLGHNSSFRKNKNDKLKHRKTCKTCKTCKTLCTVILLLRINMLCTRCIICIY